MIKQLRLENWKSFRDATLHIDPLTVLIGTNASGKSNALDALQFLARIAAGGALTTALQGDHNLPGLRGGLEWATRHPHREFALGVTVQTNERTEYSYRIECEIRHNRCQVRTESLERYLYRGTRRPIARQKPYVLGLFWSDTCEDEAPAIVARLYNENRGSPGPLSRGQSLLSQPAAQASTLRQEISAGVTAVSEALGAVFILDPIPSHMRGYSPLAEQLQPDAANIAGVIAALPAEQQARFQKTLTRYLRRLPEGDIGRVYAERVGKFATDAMLYCDERWPGVDRAMPVDARGMSDGTLRFIAILTALRIRPRGSLLVVEEVDSGLHPSRAGVLLDMLTTVGEGRGVDVLITTHNPAVLDAASPDMVPFITVAHRDPADGSSQFTLPEPGRTLGGL